MSKLSIFPQTAKIENNQLSVGGCRVSELAREFGTPLYLFDEATLRHQCTLFREEFRRRYPQSQVIYACKAYITRALARIFQEEGLGLDVVSGGELAIAAAVDFPRDKIYFHGNNKSPDELRLALKERIGRVVVDNFHELSLLDSLAGKEGVRQEIMLRLSPGVDPHTHRFTTTGIIDSKFGFPLVTGQAAEAVKRALGCAHLKLVGLHFHLGSPLFEIEPYQQAMRLVLSFAAQIKEKEGFRLEEISPGGGFAIQYLRSQPPPSAADYAEGIVGSLVQGCRELNLELPRLVIEPGRALVGRAGVAVYTVGARKDIPGVRNYVAVDGGMGDNIRPALYGAQYEALVANKAEEADKEVVTLCGKFCESGDILIKDIALPPLSAGDIIAMPGAGAYCLAMASNYNASLKPPIVLVKDGKARLIRRRESYDDLMSLDVL